MNVKKIIKGIIGLGAIGWGYTVRMWVSLAAFRKGTCWQARFQENRRWRNDPSPPIVFRLF